MTNIRLALSQRPAVEAPRLRYAVPLLVFLAISFPGFHLLSLVEASASEKERENDRQVTFRIRQKLLGDPVLERFNLGVDVRNGKAVLWGTVDTPDQQERAESVLRGFPGLRGLQNDLRIENDRGPLSLPQGALIRPAHTGTTKSSQQLRPFNSTGTFPRHGEFAQGRSVGSPFSLPVQSGPTYPTGPTRLGAAPPSARQVVGNPSAWTKPQAQRAVAVKGNETKVNRFRLGEIIGQLQRDNPRFHGVRVLVRDGFVYLAAPRDQCEELFQLAHRIAQLQGVERVIVTDFPQN
jgi:hypothetical protein